MYMPKEKLIMNYIMDMQQAKLTLYSTLISPRKSYSNYQTCMMNSFTYSGFNSALVSTVPP